MEAEHFQLRRRAVMAVQVAAGRIISVVPAHPAKEMMAVVARFTPAAAAVARLQLVCGHLVL